VSIFSTVLFLEKTKLFKLIKVFYQNLLLILLKKHLLTIE